MPPENFLEPNCVECRKMPLQTIGEKERVQYEGRPVAMGWPGEANATPRQQNASFLPPLGIFYNLLLLLYLCG